MSGDGTAFSPEALQFQNLHMALMRGEIPLAEVVRALDNRNVPPQLKQIPFLKVIANATTPAGIIIPENKNRMGFLLSFVDTNFQTGVCVGFTYGAPPAPNFGIPLLSLSPYGESNGTVSIDAIWVGPLNSVHNSVAYPATVLAYEGSLAVESHLHAQTVNALPKRRRGG